MTNITENTAEPIVTQLSLLKFLKLAKRTAPPMTATSSAISAISSIEHRQSISSQNRHQFAPFARGEAAGFLLDGFAGEEAADHVEAGGGDRGGVHAVFEEGGVSERDPAFER